MWKEIDCHQLQLDCHWSYTETIHTRQQQIPMSQIYNLCWSSGLSAVGVVELQTSMPIPGLSQLSQLVQKGFLWTSVAVRSYIQLPDATGVFMERVKKRERPKLPVHIKRLMTMWRVGLQSDMPEHRGLQLLDQSEIVEAGASGAAQALVAGTSGCVFCGSHFAGSNDDFIQQCCVCLHHWHMSCSKVLIACVRPVRATDGDNETILYSFGQHTDFGGTASESSVQQNQEQQQQQQQQQQQHPFKHHVKVSHCEVPDRFRPQADADRRTQLPYCFKVQHCNMCVLML